jgi:hypothetical protein
MQRKFLFLSSQICIMCLEFWKKSGGRCHWKDVVVVNTYKGGESLHVVGIQLSNVHTANRPLYEHYNY